MDQGSVVREEIDAGAKFLAEFEKQFPIQAAFWLKEDEGRWYLYVASDQINDQNVRLAYREVIRVAGAMRDPNFDPLALAALEILRRYPGRSAAHLRQRNFGGLGIEEGYIYPSPIPVP